jgi:Mrp family chromosome partitioning ATPase
VARSPELDWPETQAEGGLQAYLHAVRAHRLLVAVLALVTVAGSLAWLALRTPSYEATARLLISPLPHDDVTFLGLPVIHDSGDPTRTIQTAASLIRSPDAAAITARQLAGGLTPHDVLDAVQIQPEGQSDILDVVARASSPSLAKRMADLYANSILRLRDAELRRDVEPVIATLEAERARLPQTDTAAAELASRIGELDEVRRAGDPTTRVARLASTPQRPEGAPPWLVVALALFAGVVLGSGAAVLTEMLVPRRLRDAADLAQVHPIPILARVPELGRGLRGHRRASPLALPPAVVAAFRDLHLHISLQKDAATSWSAGPSQHRTLLFTGPSARDGRTTSVVGFALELAQAGQEVVLIDLDLRRPELAPALGVVADRGLDAALAPGGRLADALVPVPGLPTVRIVPGVADARMVTLDRARTRLPQLLDEALTTASYVLLDCAPLGEVGDALPLVGAVDDVILIARCDHSSLEAVETVRDLLQRACKPATGYVLVGGARGSGRAGEPLHGSADGLPRVRAVR